jgi:hypothetical protein
MLSDTTAVFFSFAPGAQLSYQRCRSTHTFLRSAYDHHSLPFSPLLLALSKFTRWSCSYRKPTQPKRDWWAFRWLAPAGLPSSGHLLLVVEKPRVCPASERRTQSPFPKATDRFLFSVQNRSIKGSLRASTRLLDTRSCSLRHGRKGCACIQTQGSICGLAKSVRGPPCTAGTRIQSVTWQARMRSSAVCTVVFGSSSHFCRDTTRVAVVSARCV